LAFEKALCKKRIANISNGAEEKVVGEDGDEVIIINSDESKEEE